MRLNVVIIHCYFQCAQMTMNNISTSNGLTYKVLTFWSTIQLELPSDFWSIPSKRLIVLIPEPVMKLGTVTKLDKRNKTMSKNFHDDVMSEYCDVIVMFWIFYQFAAVRRPDSGHRVCKGYVFSNSNLLSYKN